MGDKSAIEWTDASWNVVTGCDQVSEGCGLPRLGDVTHGTCYALTLAARLKAMGNPRYQRDGNPRTSGPGFGVTLHEDKLDQPLRWRRPRRIFTNSMSDLSVGVGAALSRTVVASPQATKYGTGAVWCTTHVAYGCLAASSAASGGSGGAAVWLDAVLAQQVPQPFELAVHPLVLLDHRLNVHAGRPLALQPQLVGEQLLFSVAQRRSAVEVARVERGLLLPPHLGELLRGVDQLGRHRQPHQPRLRTGQLTHVGQQLLHQLSDPGMVGAEPGQHLGGDALPFAEQPQQEVLGADVVVAELQRLPQRQLQHLLGAWRERDVSAWSDLAPADNLLDPGPYHLQRDAQRLQRPGGDALTLVEQAEQQVLGADVVVAQQPGFLLGEVDDPPGPVGEALEHALGLSAHRCHPHLHHKRPPSLHRCLLRAGRGTVAQSQPGCQPVHNVVGVEGAGRQLGDHGPDRLGRVR